MNRPQPPRPRRPMPSGNHRDHHAAPDRDPDLLVDPGRPLGLRLLALVGAFSFVMIGLSVLVPLLWPRPPLPRPLPGGTTGSIS